MIWKEIKAIVDNMTEDELIEEAVVRCPNPDGDAPIQLHPIISFDKVELLENPLDLSKHLNVKDLNVFDTNGCKLITSSYAIYFDYPYSIHE